MNFNVSDLVEKCKIAFKDLPNSYFDAVYSEIGINVYDKRLALTKIGILFGNFQYIGSVKFETVRKIAEIGDDHLTKYFAVLFLLSELKNRFVESEYDKESEPKKPSKPNLTIQELVESIINQLETLKITFVIEQKYENFKDVIKILEFQIEQIILPDESMKKLMKTDI